MDKRDIQIEGVLDQGIILRNGRLAVLWMVLLFPLLFPIITLCVGITVWVGAMEWDKYVVGGLVGANLFGLICFVPSLYVLIKNIKLKKSLEIWLEDSEMVNAHILRRDLIDVNSVSRQLEVNFVFQEQAIIMRSTDNLMSKYKNKWFLKYADKNVEVLYSPKFRKIIFYKSQVA